MKDDIPGRSARRTERDRIKAEIDAIMRNPEWHKLTRRKIAETIDCSHAQATYYSHKWLRAHRPGANQCALCGQVERSDNPISGDVCLDCVQRERGASYDWRVIHSLRGNLLGIVVEGWGGIVQMPDWARVDLAPFLRGDRPMPPVVRIGTRQFPPGPSTPRGVKQ